MSLNVQRLILNGSPVSEFHLHPFAAALHSVPVVLVSGDAGLAKDVKALNNNIATVAVSEGVGRSTISVVPQAIPARQT